MSEETSNDEIEREFEALAKKARLHIPEDRRAGLLNGYRELRGMVALLRQGLPPSTEPASTYSLDNVTRIPRP